MKNGKKVIKGKSNVQINSDLKRMLKIYCAEHDKNMGQVIEQLLTNLLIEYDQKLKKAIKETR